MASSREGSSGSGDKKPVVPAAFSDILAGNINNSVVSGGFRDILGDINKPVVPGGFRDILAGIPSGGACEDGSRVRRVDRVRLESCTESVGSESFCETTTSRIDDLEVETTPWDMRSALEARSARMAGLVRSFVQEPHEFPPPISTLDGNGRPRFTFFRNRSDGRLRITVVRNDRPNVVRTAQCGDGTVRMNLVVDDRDRGGDGDGEEIQAEETGSDGQDKLQ